MAIVNVLISDATVSNNYLANLYASPVWYGDRIVSAATSMALIGDNGFGARYGGTFAYDALGQPRGLVTDYSFILPAAQGASGSYSGSAAQYTMTAINGTKGLAAQKLFEFSAAGNTTGALSYLLSKNDVINGSGFDRTGIDETLYGWAGNDTIFGIAGEDIIGGGSGKDRLIGGNGQDFFFFDFAHSRHADVIEDFGFGGVRDTLVFQQSAFNGLAAGPLAETQFVVGKIALDADDRIILDGNRLYYDADGNGAAKAVLVATIKYAMVGLVGVSAVTAQDVIVVNSIGGISVA